MSENSLFLLSQNKQIKLWHDKSTNKISHPHSFCRNIFYCGALDAHFISSAVIRMRFRKLLYCNACNGYHWPVSMTFYPPPLLDRLLTPRMGQNLHSPYRCGRFLWLGIFDHLSTTSATMWCTRISLKNDAFQCGITIVFGKRAELSYFCPFRTWLIMCIHIRRAMPWAKETIGLSARLCLFGY